MVLLKGDDQAAVAGVEGCQAAHVEHSNLVELVATLAGLADQLGILGVVALADHKVLAHGIPRPLADHLDQAVQGLSHAPHFLVDFDIAIAILAADRVDIEHRGHHAHSPIHAPGADQGFQRADEEKQG